MKELHIPFGLDSITKTEIEPEDAAQGRACNCLCPGCEAPLISRHPKDPFKRIHFAHDSKHPDAKPIDQCPLSPYVALGMMLRRVSDQLTGKVIRLNPFSKWIDFDCCGAPNSFIQISPAQIVLIEHSETSPTYGGVSYDLCLSLMGKLYFVDLSYPGKPRKDKPVGALPEAIGGIFSIDGEEFMVMMGEGEFKTKRYSESVIHFLIAYSTKNWVYHSNQHDLVLKAKKTHRCISKHQSNRAAYASRYSNPYVARNSDNVAGADPYQLEKERLRKQQEDADAYRRASGGDDRTVRPNLTRDLPRSIDQSNPTPQYSAPAFRPNTDNDTQSTRYLCLFCDLEFSVGAGASPTCPTCRRHLGARRLPQ